MRGGSGPIKPLPFKLGANGGMLPFPDGSGADAAGLAAALDIGQVIYRNDMPWNWTKGTFTGIEGLPGVYSSTQITKVQNIAALLKSNGIAPLFLLECNSGSVMCPCLGVALTAGQTNVNTLTFPSWMKTPQDINTGDTFTLTDPTNQAHTQTGITVTSAKINKGTAGAVVSVTPFTSTFAMPAAVQHTASGAWVYDTAWPACTPQHLANTMAMLVAQPGLQGLHWELLNEPDGLTWAVDESLCTQVHQLAYASMKAADPTCVVHGLVIENLAPLGFPEGTPYYNNCIANGIKGNYDFLNFHQYGNNPTGGTLDCPPDAGNIWGRSYWKMIADFKTNMISKADNVKLWCTEFGWRSTGDGIMTPAIQADFYKALLTELSGKDPINNVQFSSYLDAMCLFTQTGTFQDWSIIDQHGGLPGVPKPVYATLKQLVAGH
jgi:hypothetical protein